MGEKTRGAIAAGHQKTAEAGQIIFELGGNAFDAAIAAMLASCVVESTLTSIGGGGFFLAHTKERQKILFDFFCQTPSQKKQIKDLDFYAVNLDFKGASQVFHIGLGSIAVPGTLAGIFEVHKQLGKLPFHVVAEPAIEYARNGYQVTKYNRVTFEILEPILTGSKNSQKLYAPDGNLLETGENAYIKDFANILEELIKKGVQEFYQGEIAHQIIRDVSPGGHLTLEDLSQYCVIKRHPIKFQYRGYEILTNPPPSSGGILIAYCLKLLENYPINSLEWGSKKHLEILAQVMALTNEARKMNYDNYVYQNNIVENFLSQENLEKSHKKLEKTLNKWGSTTHISVIDQEGNAASVTNSNGEGSSYVIPNTGIMLNNMLGEADLNPLGFHTWESDRRISSMMSPSIILKEGKPEIVLGSGGSNRIRTAILQVISNLLDFNLPLENAINCPRVHWEDNIFNLEPMSQLGNFESLDLPPETQIVPWQEPGMFFGGVHGVKYGEAGTLEGFGDPRRAGVAIVC
ncbi:gamma-glutamyltransferase [Crocosphaera sp. XPORK-15E]|uniref:gamma-glutamyltransferase n=1 Tax=Crocosphaera sp. XPORK-15E TaxID=3110247 RepID=UPI002B1EF8CB|nr:gamma-glutamyltransferase [Crocosphaera sp. XPORK-15E]MEA5532937.1 gamma-glutamyltransferase [Crocosphaera sp. XPORK-15E]